MGKVYLVGGGPGDIELLTKKAFRCIEEADCLIYDRLIDPKVLKYTKDDCEKIYVGKRASHHTMRQEQINELLVEKAKEHGNVVRLKGGDVYVFGRGGEEAIHLRKNGVEFEVVPGISSSIAGLAYAGIPITHRGVSTGFHVVTAHDRNDELADIDFEAMARGNDTCVFLMGLSKVDEIVSRLLEAGKPKGTSIALISNATRPQQKTLVSTLEHVRGDLERQPMVSPALIVVGDVVNLREQLNFYEEKPLFGKRILVPTVSSVHSKLGEILSRYGADVTEVPTGAIASKETALEGTDLKSYQYLIVNSKNAVDCLLRQMKKYRIDVRSLSNCRIACVGKQTAEYLESFGVIPDLVPERYDSDALCALLKQEVHKDDKVLLLGVEGVHNALTEELADKCVLERIDLYANEACTFELKEEIFDLIVFTCSSAVHNTMKQLSREQAERAKIFSIGAKTTKALQGYGMRVIQSEEATYDSLIETVLKVR